MSRLLVPLAWAASLLLALGLGAWAALATLAPPPTGVVDRGPTLYTVSEGTVSRVQSFTADAKWGAALAARNAAIGTVTTIDFAARDEVSVGQRLYSVDLRPVVAAQGSIPSFRDLEEGASGADVEQLQQFLTQAGHYRGAASGSFGTDTAFAVRAWQKSVGVVADGVARVGDLIYLTQLPARLAPDPGLEVGARLSGGEPSIMVLPPAPAFTITLGIEQADLIPLVTSAVIHHRDGTWIGTIASSTSTPNGELLLSLAGADGAGVCGDECAVVPVGVDSVFTVDLVAVPKTTGPVVPAAALQTTPDGGVVVIEADGSALPVQIIAAAEGRAVVAGLEPGTVIRLFGLGVAP